MYTYVLHIRQTELSQVKCECVVCLRLTSTHLDVLGQSHLVLFGHVLGDLHSFGLLVLRQKPSWRLWDKPANTKLS